MGVEPGGGVAGVGDMTGVVGLEGDIGWYAVGLVAWMCTQELRLVGLVGTGAGGLVGTTSTGGPAEG